MDSAELERYTKHERVPEANRSWSGCAGDLGGEALMISQGGEPMVRA